MMGGSSFSLFLGVAMIAVFALTLGAITLLRRGEDRKRGWLMLVAALVLLGNVLIWTV
jgi:hypothetical protein